MKHERKERPPSWASKIINRTLIELALHFQACESRSEFSRKPFQTFKLIQPALGAAVDFHSDKNEHLVRFDLLNERLFGFFLFPPFFSKGTKASFTSVSISRVPRRRKRFLGVKKIFSAAVDLNQFIRRISWARFIAGGSRKPTEETQVDSHDLTRRMHPEQAILINLRSVRRQVTCRKCFNDNFNFNFTSPCERAEQMLRQKKKENFRSGD
jgi:hypothetical protein